MRATHRLYPENGPFEMRITDPRGTDFRIVHGSSEAAQILRDFIVGGTLEELGYGHNPKVPRFDIYPVGPNRPGALHVGINGLKTSECLRRVMPNWEAPRVHMDLVTFDSTVVAGNNVLIEDGYLMSLRNPAVIEAAGKYGDPVELLEQFPV
jgi:hypothetical protein